MQAVLKTFRYRFYPTKGQQRALEAMLGESRWLYNHFLEERRTAWKQTGKSLNYYEQAISLPRLKRNRASLARVHSQVLQNVAVRVDLAFKARRIKAGEKAGYPRFCGWGRYDSFTFPQYPSGCRLKNGRLFISEVGHLKIILHRPLAGRPKTVTIGRTPTGKWFAAFACDCEPTPLPPCDEAVGIDLGLTAFARQRDGQKLENPEFVRKEEKALAQSQRRLSKQAKGTPDDASKVVARVDERAAWKRQDFIHQHSRRVVNRFGIIAVEDQWVNRLVHNHSLARSILDAAWAGFVELMGVHQPGLQQVSSSATDVPL